MCLLSIRLTYLGNVFIPCICLLAVDYPAYPAYPMVICQVIDKLKLVLLFAAQYLTGRVKMTVIFVS